MLTKRIASALLISVLLIAACAPTVIQIPVRKPAAVDVGSIRKIAVVDFAGPQGSGKLAASLLTSGLLNAGFYKIFEREKIDQILEEHKLAMAGVVDASSARQVGQLLGVDGLIFGEVTAFTVEPDQHGVQKIEKKIGTGKYRIVKKGNKKVREEIKKTVLVDQQYIIRRGTVSVTFRMVNVETGELVASIANSKTYNSGKVIEGQGRLKARKEILYDLLKGLVNEFVAQVSPHIVIEKRKLENGKGAMEVGVKYAKNGLWDDARQAFLQAVKTNPSDAKAHYNLGIAYEVAGNFDLAEKEYKKAIVLSKKDLYFSALANLKKMKAEREKLKRQTGI